MEQDTTFKNRLKCRETCTIRSSLALTALTTIQAGSTAHQDSGLTTIPVRSGHCFRTFALQDRCQGFDLAIVTLSNKCIWVSGWLPQALPLVACAALLRFVSRGSPTRATRSVCDAGQVLRLP